MRLFVCFMFNNLILMYSNNMAGGVRDGSSHAHEDEHLIIFNVAHFTSRRDSSQLVS